MTEPTQRRAPLQRSTALVLLGLVAASCWWMLHIAGDAAASAQGWSYSQGKRNVGAVYMFAPLIGLAFTLGLAFRALLWPRIGFAFVCILSGLATVAAAALCIVYLPMAFGTMLGGLRL